MREGGASAGGQRGCAAAAALRAAKPEIIPIPEKFRNVLRRNALWIPGRAARSGRFRARNKNISGRFPRRVGRPLESRL
jgi:hypothetical protein